MEFRERPAFRRGQSLRPLFRNTFVGAVLFSILLTDCSHKRPILTRTDHPAPSMDRGKDVGTDLGPHTRPHLHGWRRAETHLEETFRTLSDPEVLNRLLTTQFLILTREAEEGIYGPFQAERLSSLCSRGTSSFHEALCRTAQERLRRRDSRSTGTAPISNSIGDGDLPMEDPLLAAYVRFLVTGGRPESGLSGQNPLEVLDPDKTSPLTLYLAWKAGRIEKTSDHIERHPGFAELLLYRGNRLLEETRYTEAIQSMTEATRLVPEYTQAMVALGEFHLRSLHLYRRALRYFEDALTWDPQNISALFGHGVVLHLLGRHQHSQDSLDRLLELEPVVWNSIPQESRKSFGGRTCYWKAKNYFAAGSSAKAREWVDRGPWPTSPALKRPCICLAYSTWRRESSHRLAPIF